MSENQLIEWKETWRDEYLKWICGFSNAKGGKIYIGVNDKGEIIGVDKIDKLMEELPNKIRNAIGIVVEVNHLSKGEKNYIEIAILPHPFPVSYHGKYYLRSGSTLQLLSGSTLDEFMLRKQGITWDSVPVPYISSNELSDEAIKLFIDKAIKKGRLESSLKDETKESLVEKLNITKNGYLTNAAILMFHDTPEQYVFGSFIKIGFFESDSEIIYQDEIHGSIIGQVDEAMSILHTKYLKAKISYDGIQRIEKYPFPEEAIREALLNAIVHKDYTKGVPIQISVYDDRLYIANDGKLPEEWKLEDLLGKHNSKPHNPRIAHVFYLAGFIESWGRGVEKIFTACQADGLEIPQYTVHSSDIMIKFTAPEDRVIHTGKRVVSDKVTDKVTDINSSILELIKEDERVSMQQMADTIGVSKKTINNHIKELKESGAIERIGSSKKGYWELK